MTLTRTFLGKHPDTGAPYYGVVNDDPDRAVLITGPATGDLTMSDGTVYNVDGDAVLIHKDHLEEIHHHIETQHEQTGALGSDFTHGTCAHCKKGK